MEENKSTTKRGCGGCLTAFVCVFLLLAALITCNALTPYFREQRPVTVTITDEANQPIADATIHIQEFEWILFIPPLTFASPSHLIDRRRTVTTDSQGKAQFTVKLENAIANRITVNGQPLRVLSHQTNDSFRGTGRLIPIPARSDYGLTWGAIGGVSKVSYETTVVVSTAEPK
jgi:hypothetical protein